MAFAPFAARDEHIGMMHSTLAACVRACVCPREESGRGYAAAHMADAHMMEHARHQVLVLCALPYVFRSLELRQDLEGHRVLDLVGG